MAKVHVVADQTLQTKALLRGLLRTPKTRKGLIAAAKSQGLSRSFVIGWLTDMVRTSIVVRLASGDYQLASALCVEPASASVYPAWLDPRTLPVFIGREAYLDGSPVTDKE